MNMRLRNIPFSPPDMTEKEAALVREAILSGWITTGPRTKKLEAQISEYVHTDKTVCLNSATAALEMVLHLLDLKPEDEVIVPAYTYTATASVTQHVGRSSAVKRYSVPSGMARDATLLAWAFIIG